jgi:glycosyl transferase family 1
MALPDFAIARRLAVLARLPVGSVADHCAVFDGVLDLAWTSVKKNHTQDAAFLAQLAADFAWFSHPGRFTDPGLEECLAKISTRLPAPAISQHVENRTVLHVLTQAYSIGGHTRLAWRWISADTSRRHSIVLTGQGAERVPPQLQEVVKSSGGTFHMVDSSAGLAQRAGALRELMSDVDAVVLHTQPYDVVPVLALAAWDSRPPVLLVNHADHVFWVGAPIADQIVCLRASGARLAVARRAAVPEAISTLAIPVPPPSIEPGKAEARARLSLDPHAVVAVSVGSPYKFQPIDELSFSSMSVRVAATAPMFQLLVAGPKPVGRWAEAEAASGGQVRALGTRSDLEILFRAADMYLDPFPFSSLTALLEAGSSDCPVVCLRAHPSEAEVLSADSPGLEGALVAPSSEDDYVAQVRGFVDDATLRMQRGRETAEIIRRVNWGPLWLDAMETAFARAGLRRHAAGTSAETTGPPNALDDRLVALHRGYEGLGRAVGRQLAAAPRPLRWSLGVASASGGGFLPLSSYVPDAIKMTLRSVRERF